MKSTRKWRILSQLALCALLWVALLGQAALAQTGGGSFDPSRGFGQATDLVRLIAILITLGCAVMAIIYRKVAILAGGLCMGALVVYMAGDAEGTMDALGSFIGKMVGFSG